MKNELRDCEVSNEDLRAALREMGSYIDVTEDDLRKIYLIALKHAQERLAIGIPVRDVMTGNVITVRPAARLCEAAELLADNRISGLPVVDTENHVIGVITEEDVLSMAGVSKGHTFRDILKHLLGEPLPKRGEGNAVIDFMNSPAITIGPDVDVREAARLLSEKRIKRLPVIDKENRLIGIVSRADIVRATVRR